MKRVLVFIAALLACAVITATPASAQDAKEVAPVSAPAAVQAVEGLQVGFHQNWFSDYNACIWGVGVPAGVAWVIVTTPQTWYSISKLKSIPGVGWYVPRVMAACGRFIRS